MSDILGILIMVGQVVLALSILIGVHEFGHLIAAKIFGMRVEQFSIGFPPKIFSIKFGETVYSIGSIPLGGFVKISGMIDESLDTKTLSEEPKPYEFRAKPAWQRLIVMLGGILVNVIVGVTIFVFLTYIYGESYISKEELNKNGIVALEIGKEIGLETGDKIIKVNGHDFQKYSDLLGYNVLLSDDSYYTVERNGQLIDIHLPHNLIEKISDRKSDKGFIEMQMPFTVGKLEKNMGAIAAGLKEGDKIIEVNGQKIEFFHQFKEVLDENKLKKVDVEILRDGVKKDLQVQISDDGKMGFRPKIDLQESHINYTFAASVGKGTKRAFEAVWVNIKAFGRMFAGKLDPTKSLRGPIGIMEEFGYTWDWQRFWSLTGLLSMVLAFMNFLPIPALDGGHVAFLTYEIVSGRKPSDKFLENAQKVGMVLLLLLMAFVIINDVINF